MVIMMRRMLSVLIACSSCAHAQPHAAPNTSIVQVDTLAFDKGSGLKVENFVWSRAFTKADAEKAFRPGMSRYAMSELNCGVAADGSLTNCTRQRAPDSATMLPYFEAMERAFVVSPETLRRIGSNALTIHIDIQTANSAGAEVIPVPCLPAFCVATPPPPLPPERGKNVR